MAWKVKITVLREGASYLQDEFTHSPITLGALPDSDLLLDDPFVSGQHAVVMVSRGQMVFRDLSRNGSFIEGQRVREKELGHQATVEIPPFRLDLEFQMDDRARQTQFHARMLPVAALDRVDALAHGERRTGSNQ